MSVKKLSERTRFNDALILSSEYFANPGMNGETQLAILELKSKIQVWSWCEDYVDVILELPIGSHWREIVSEALDNEIFASAVMLNDIQIIRDRPPLGQMLGFAITDYDQDKIRGKLLLKLSDQSLLQLSRFQHDGLYDSKILGILDKVSETIESLFMDLDDLQEPKLKDVFNLYDLEKAFDLSLKNAAKAIEKSERECQERERAKQAKLLPFQERIQQILNKWSSNRPISRYPGTGSTCTMGLGRFRSYLEDYVLENNDFPKGKHVIPAGKDCWGTNGPEFQVDFDIF